MDLFKSAEQIYQAALNAVSPKKLLKGQVSFKQGQLFVLKKQFDLTSFKHIYVAAFGKSAPQMADSLISILGKRVNGGIFLRPDQENQTISPLKAMKASHPYPDENSIRAAKKILCLAERLNENDLLITLISGGGSSHLCLPPPDVPLKEKSTVIQNLLLAGADIKELNTVRKHLSRIKGGRLARAAFPASVISLIISDVIGDDLETIASGPTHWDSTTFQHAVKILKKHRLWRDSPDCVRRFLRNGIKRKTMESLKKGDPAFKKVCNVIIGNNQTALKAASQSASRLGFKVLLLSSSEQGEARLKACEYVSLLLKSIQHAKPGLSTQCFLAGGELTVSVKGSGKGGRNQEFVLAFIKKAREAGIKQGGWVVLSMGTDGIDGPTDAAGAWGSLATLNRIEELSLKPGLFLDQNDSYHFFKKTGGLIKTGPTGTNVMDLRILLKE
ncbi:MAG: DUF4147 domain-containing protein [Candidatus Aminicenantes bacterium]|nr:DUF4147 domain-containing protein [Candidatus Aminicenantes bacterium]